MAPGNDCKRYSFYSGCSGPWFNVLKSQVQRMPGAATPCAIWAEDLCTGYCRTCPGGGRSVRYVLTVGGVFGSN